MSGRYLVREAVLTDNEGLLDLINTCPMESSTSIITERSPDFFALNRLQGDPFFVAVAEDREGKLVGSGSIAMKDTFINGRSVTCMYGGDLRVDPSVRHGTLVRELHDICRQRSRELDVNLWYVYVLADNHRAQVLAHNHHGMPVYRALGRVRVCNLSFLSTGRHSCSNQIEIATLAEIPQIVRVLNEYNSRYQFAPVWSEQSFEKRLRDAPGLSIDNFYVAKENDRIIGVLAAWDQSIVQRTRVMAYPRKANLKRCLHNIAARATGLAPLPGKGKLLKQLYITQLAVPEDRPAILRDLLCRVGQEYRRKGYHCCTFGLAEGHPLLEALQGFIYQAIQTVVWAVIEPGSEWDSIDLSGRLPYYEASHT
jgi:hypothetical protein